MLTYRMPGSSAWLPCRAPLHRASLPRLSRALPYVSQNGAATLCSRWSEQTPLTPLQVMAACSGDARSLGHTGCHVPPGPTGPLAPGHAVGSRAEGIVLGLFATTMDGIELSRLPRPPGEKPPVLNLIAR